MIANGQVKPKEGEALVSLSKGERTLAFVPVGHQSVFWASKHRSHVGGVLARRVEVRVVA